MNTWKDYLRKNDTAIILGFSPTTRHLTPFDAPDKDLFTLNEEYHYDWVKRPPDFHFQIHPRWDFTRTNNTNHYNHFMWLKNEQGMCVRCKGEGGWEREGKDGVKEAVKCPECDKGIYTPPEWREKLPIFMQEHWDDIPNSVKYPLQEATDALPLDYPYFTSSVALLLMLTHLMGYKRVEMYGFEMGMNTEYHYQRANGEYLMGYLQGKGMEIYLPKETTLLKGELYGYKNMKQGYRMNLEMRGQFLEMQEKMQSAKVNVMTGEIQTLQGLVAEGHSELAPRLNDRQLVYMKAIGTQNVLRGAIAETTNLTSLYDAYFTAGIEEGKVLSAEETQAFVNVAYEQ
jgi:hypothetical protein